jgi:tetratricopeptide (TPR) repeat protein
MENHDDAYYAWKESGARERILVHIDSHMDWDWLREHDPRELLHARTLTELDAMLKGQGCWTLRLRDRLDPIHIGNYIQPALRQGIVREFYWVFPDVAVSRTAEPSGILRMLRKMMRGNPTVMRNLRVQGRRIQFEIDETPVTACTLSDLPSPSEPVLLDIDTDFFTADPSEYTRTGRSGHDRWRQLPWIWPEELLVALRGKGLRTDFVTIAYSVEGGFTPLSYKYLGDELAARLRHPILPEPDRSISAHKRMGAWYRHFGFLGRAIEEFETAAALAPDDASSRFSLAYLYDEQGAIDQAGACYRRAVLLDPSYSTAYNNFGHDLQCSSLLDRARAEYERILRWDPKHADARLGLAETWTHQEHWEKAQQQYQAILDSHPDQADANRELGRVYVERGLWDDAIVQLKRAIVLEPAEGSSYARLGDAYYALDRWHEAMEAYQASVRYGFRSVSLYLRLGSLYLGKCSLYKAWNQYRKGVRLGGRIMLVFLLTVGRALRQRLTRGLHDGHRWHPTFEERTDPLADH